MTDDARWMGAATALADRARGQTWPNPNVGCVIVSAGRVVGRGWTQPGGRPHAEAVALAQAGEAGRGATLYTTLEPCAHASQRGPTCSTLIAKARVARVVMAVRDPDPRTDGTGAAVLRRAGVAIVENVTSTDAARAMAGFLTRHRFGRPHVTLKLALSLDGCIARTDGESRWITGESARAHGHLERARADMILVGRGTWEIDAPKLDVRLSGLEGRSPSIVILSGLHQGAEVGSDSSPPPLRAAACQIASPSAITDLEADWLLVEGGAATASAFLVADLVDRLLIYHAPILIGDGKSALGDIGLTRLTDAHGRWRAIDSRTFAPDRLDIYERVRD